MSKASEWAKHFGDRPVFHQYGFKVEVANDGSCSLGTTTAQRITAAEACEIARWILDTFGDPARE